MCQIQTPKKGRVQKDDDNANRVVLSLHANDINKHILKPRAQER